MRAANGFILAAAVAVLLVHFHSHSAAGLDRAFSGNALGAANVTAYVVGGDALDLC